MRVPSGLRIDSPAWPLLRGLTTYWGITSGNGNALGTTAVCADLDNWATYTGQQIHLYSGPSGGQTRQIAAHAAGGILTVGNPFTNAAGAAQQIVAGTLFVILPVGGGGISPGPPPPSVGLWMFGVCDPGMAASLNTIVCPNLAGLPEDIFNDEFWMQVIHNDDAPGTAPEREIRRITNFVSANGTFTTDDFSANVEADDIVAIFHESIMSCEILGFGTLDTSSQTVPADSTRAAAYAWENNDYFKGCIFMPTEGACRFQPRPIQAYVAATGVFTLDEPFSQLPGLVDYVIVKAAYPVQRLLDIFNIVNAILMTTETGGTLTTDGAEQDLYINNAPAGVYEPLKLQLDCTLMQAGDSIRIRTYYRINPAGNLIKKDDVTFAGAQDPDLKNVELEPNRYGIWVSITRTGGVDRAYDWAVFYRA